MCVRDEDVMIRRRHDDDDDLGALSRRARPTWSVLTLIGAIITAAGAVLAAEHVVATAAAQALIGPVERKLDDHLASSVALRQIMDRYVAEQAATNRANSMKLDALCRANPRAQCPLGSP